MNQLLSGLRNSISANVRNWRSRRTSNQTSSALLAAKIATPNQAPKALARETLSDAAMKAAPAMARDQQITKDREAIARLTNINNVLNVIFFFTSVLSFLSWFLPAPIEVVVVGMLLPATVLACKIVVLAALIRTTA